MKLPDFGVVDAFFPQLAYKILVGTPEDTYLDKHRIRP
jgi:hypothetical protein